MDISPNKAPFKRGEYLRMLCDSGQTVRYVRWCGKKAPNFVMVRANAKGPAFQMHVGDLRSLTNNRQMVQEVLPMHYPKSTRSILVSLVLLIACFLLVESCRLIMGSTKTAQAQALSCERIKDPDRRNYCRAMTSGKKSYCEFIKKQDLREECRALVREKK